MTGAAAPARIVISVCIAGISGKVGRALAAAVVVAPDLDLAGGVSRRWADRPFGDVVETTGQRAVRRARCSPCAGSASGPGCAAGWTPCSISNLLRQAAKSCGVDATPALRELMRIILARHRSSPMVLAPCTPWNQVDGHQPPVRHAISQPARGQAQILDFDQLPEERCAGIVVGMGKQRRASANELDVEQ